MMFLPSKVGERWDPCVRPLRKPVSGVYAPSIYSAYSRLDLSGGKAKFIEWRRGRPMGCAGQLQAQTRMSVPPSYSTSVHQLVAQTFLSVLPNCCQIYSGPEQA